MVTRTVLRSVPESMPTGLLLVGGANAAPVGDSLRSCEQIHLAEKFFDAHAGLLALGAQILKFLAQFAGVRHRNIALIAERGHQIHRTVDALFECRQSVVV